MIIIASYFFHLFMFSIFLLSDEGHGAVAEANLQDDLGPNPPSFAEVSRELQLTSQFNKILNL